MQVYEKTFIVPEPRKVGHDVEDGGQARIIEPMTDEENGVFVRLQSWDSTGAHPEISAIVGRRIRILVEVID